MWPRLRLDIGWSDLADGLSRCLLPSHTRCERTLEGAVPCLSVRSGFDLFLSALDLPPRSEVLLSAITVPDMARIVEHHRLSPVPVDLEPRDLGPSLNSLKRSWTPRSRVLVVAHLFGRVHRMDEIAAFTREHDLLLVEDFAQAYCRPQSLSSFTGDAALFSFGPIKLNTALGGGLVCSSSSELLDRIRDLQSAYGRQSRVAFASRLAKYATVKAALNPPAFGAILKICKALRIDHDRVFARAAKNFSGEFSISRFRKRPCRGLLQLMARRIEQSASDDTAVRRLEIATEFAQQLDLAPFDAGWLVPVVVDEPEEVVARLRSVHVDVAQASRLTVVRPPTGRPELTAVSAEELLRDLLLIPVHPDMPARQVTDICSAIEPSLRTSSAAAIADQADHTYIAY